jgi:hypothetical protein
MMGVNACLFTMKTAEELLTNILSNNIYKHFLNSVGMFKATGLNLALMHYPEGLLSPNVCSLNTNANSTMTSYVLKNL